MYCNRFKGHSLRTIAKSLLAITLCGPGLFLTHPTDSAQTDTARIAGTLQDTTGAILPGATVTITNIGTNAVTTATGDSSGTFVVNALPIGPYKATVTAAGFSSQTKNFTLFVSQVQSLDFKLAVGAESTRIPRHIPATPLPSATRLEGSAVTSAEHLQVE